MELKQLRLFLKVAEVRSYTVASEQVGLAQSALSRQIKNLEYDLGVSLFDRSRRQICLTPAGEVLQQRARQVLDLAQAVSLEVSSGTHTPTGTVSIAAHSSFGGFVFPRLASRIHEIFPRVKLSLHEGSTDSLTERLCSGEIDLAVVAYIERSSRLDVTKLCSEKMFLVSRADDDTELGTECDLERALHLPLITTAAESRERLALEREAIKFGISPNVTIESDSFHSMLPLVVRGFGHCILPQSAILQESGPKEWKATRIRGMSVDRFLACRADRPTSFVSAKVVEVLREVVASCLDGKRDIEG